MRRYRVQPWDRAPIVDRIAAALEACNVQILERPHQSLLGRRCGLAGDLADAGAVLSQQFIDCGNHVCSGDTRKRRQGEIFLERITVDHEEQFG